MNPTRITKVGFISHVLFLSRLLTNKNFYLGGRPHSTLHFMGISKSSWQLIHFKEVFNERKAIEFGGFKNPCAPMTAKN